MPIEIRELVIRAIVDPTGSDKEKAGGCGTPAGKGSPGGESDAVSSPEGDLVQACVREVMRILERKAER